MFRSAILCLQYLVNSIMPPLARILEMSWRTSPEPILLENLSLLDKLSDMVKLYNKFILTTSANIIRNQWAKDYCGIGSGFNYLHAHCVIKSRNYSQWDVPTPYMSSRSHFTGDFSQSHAELCILAWWLQNLSAVLLSSA